MYRFIRLSQIDSVRLHEGVAFAKKINDYVNKKFPDLDMQVMVQHFGDHGVVMWTADLDDLGVYQQIMGALMEDREYQGLLKNAEGLFLRGQATDQLFTVL